MNYPILFLKTLFNVEKSQTCRNVSNTRKRTSPPQSPGETVVTGAPSPPNTSCLFPTNKDIFAYNYNTMTFLVAQMVKVSAYGVGDLGSIPGSGRSPGEGNGNPLQYCCLENPMDGETW